METRTKGTKTAVSVLVLAGLVVFGLTATGGNLEPSGPPAATMKSLDEVEPRKPIGQADIPLTITESGSYYLTCDVNSAGTAITVEANDVTIDLMGYKLIGPGSGINYGIYMNGHTNVEIRNGTITKFGSHVIHEADSNKGKGHRLINLRIISNGGWGVYLRGSGHLVKDCTVAANFIGISPGYSSTVTGNTAYDNNGQGISVSTGCTVTGNTAYNNTAGIATSSGCTIVGNTAYNNRQDGIVAGTASLVTGNTTYYNQNAGIYAPYACTVSGNTVGYNNQSNTVGFAGLYVNDNCLVKGNTVIGNKQNNIYVENSNNAIEENLVTVCSPGNGINFNSTGNFYANNRASDNGTDYANTAGQTDGGGNYSF